MSENKEIRAIARDRLEHRLFGDVWVNLVLVVLIGSIIVGIPSSISTSIANASVALGASVGLLFSLAAVVLEGVIAYGMARIFLKVARGEKKVDFKEIFCGFKEEPAEVILLGFLRGLFIGLWSLLFIVPGIIKAYSYSMAFYIQQESPDKNWRSCLDRSKELMDGYKGKLFRLDLSFIGWYILGFLCLGFGELWVSVYHEVARAEFYEQLKKEKDVSYTQEAPDDLADLDFYSDNAATEGKSEEEGDSKGLDLRKPDDEQPFEELRDKDPNDPSKE